MMYTQCSRCSTLFRLTVRHLREAHGQVRCCLCHQVFDALPSLIDKLPPDLPIEDGQGGWQVPSRRRPGALPRAASVEAKPETDDLFVEERAEDQPDLFVGLDLAADIEPEPRPRAGKAVSAWRTGLLWSAGALLLIVLLLAQYAYIMRDALSQDVRLRPWLEALCVVARCELPLLRDLDSLHVLQRRVVAHPERGDALMVRATLVNEAAFRQPFPDVRLRFLDGAGKVAAERWFRPDEYLEEARIRTQVKQGMPPKEPIAVRLELVDPGESAAENFELEFR